ncbi:MAG: tetratricopeptide repeat protein [Marinicellaceae bacterium]
MTDKTNFFEELISRRIPHILGMYIAAVWLSVEIADWMSERFGVADQFSSYVFVGMLTFIPSVIMLAWGHGRPGKDSWSRLELAWLPLNILLSVFAVNQLVEPQVNTNPIASPPVVSAPIENLQPNTFVANNEENKAIHNNVMTFFWENKTNDNELDWLSYGSSWLFSQDLKRTPDISAITPYDSRMLLVELINKGFPTALNVPLALAIQIANKQSKEWVVMGSFQFDDVQNDFIKFEAKLYNVKTGKMEKTFVSVNQDKLTSIDEISNEFGDFLLKSNNNTNIIPDYAIADHTSNNIEAIKKLIEAKNVIAFENNYPKAIEIIEQALVLDQSFAEAMLLASNYYKAQGDFENATKYSKKALDLDYKIYKESVFATKASLFDMTGQQNKALMVLENWAEMFPTSPLAHATLANKYLFGDNTLDKAEEQFEKLLSIDSNDQTTLISLGQIYRVQGEKEKTLDVLKQYLESNPEKVNAYMELANAYNQFGMFDEAIEMYQKASIMGSENYAAEIGLASTTATQGDYLKGLDLLNELLSEDNSDIENLMVHNQKVLIYMQIGQISKAFEELELLKKPAEKLLQPLNYIFSIDGSAVQLLVLSGKYTEALEYTKSIRENTKPPFNKIANVFNITTYDAMEDKINFEKALNAFETFLETYPLPAYKPYVSAWNARLHYWNGDLKGSLNALDLAIEESKQSIVSLRTNSVIELFIIGKAELLFELQDVEGALKEIEFLLKRNPLLADAHLLQAKIYQSLDEEQKAEKSIQKVKEIWKYADADFVGLKQLEEFE